MCKTLNLKQNNKEASWKHKLEFKNMNLNFTKHYKAGKGLEHE